MDFKEVFSVELLAIGTVIMEMKDGANEPLGRGCTKLK